jgi:hypothetical protein
LFFIFILEDIMKTLFKPILAAFTAIILCVSMMGCDGVEKASSAIGISQKEGVPDGSGIATFRFPKGV